MYAVHCTQQSVKYMYAAHCTAREQRVKKSALVLNYSVVSVILFNDLSLVLQVYWLFVVSFVGLLSVCRQFCRFIGCFSLVLQVYWLFVVSFVGLLAVLQVYWLFLFVGSFLCSFVGLLAVFVGLLAVFACWFFSIQFCRFIVCFCLLVLFYLVFFLYFLCLFILYLYFKYRQFGLLCAIFKPLS